MQLVGNESEGLRLEFTGMVDISDISPEYLQEQIVLKMRFEGRDIAGNQFETQGNSQNSPAGLWYLVHYTPDFEIEQSGIELSKSNIEVDETTIIQVHIRNEGMLGGDANVLVEIVDLNGERTQLDRASIFVDAESVSTLIVDWKPNSPGIQRIEVTLGDNIEKSEFIDVQPAKESSFLEDSIGSVNPWILGITLVMSGLGLLFILSWMRLATISKGESEEDWELEEDEADFDD